jgi:hypothetical protein
MGKKKLNAGGFHKEHSRRFHPETERAARLIQTHRAVVGAISPPEMLSDGSFRIRFKLAVALPSRSRASGVSQTGVRAQEDVVFHFPASYPMKAPRIYLRHDFNRSLSHFNPMPGFGGGDLVTPCVYQGSLDELLQQHGDGLSEILNHLSEWLGKAAVNDLIDSDQGWESIRRDEILGWLIFDAARMRSIVETQPNGGGAFFHCCYVRSLLTGHYPIARITGNDRYAMQPGILAKILSFKSRFWDEDVLASTAVFAWPDVGSGNGEAAVAGRYFPENVTNLDQLIDRADEYGCGAPLRSKLSELTWAYMSSHTRVPLFPLFVILCALRPYHLIGEDSSLELIPYVIECRFEEMAISSEQGNLVISPDSEVKSIGHRHALSTELLRRVSGVKESMAGGPIVQLGCGSLGSKIVMHLARCGSGPFLLCDKSSFSPHNAARHALLGHPELPGLPKALLLAWEVEQLKQNADTDSRNIIDIWRGMKNGAHRFPNDTRLIIDATGSIPVREALASLPAAQVSGRLLHTALFADGEVGLMAIEGSARNPSIGDIIVRFWDRRIDDACLASKLENRSDSIQRQSIGQGCDSYTMIMPDTRVSLFAAGMAEKARQMIEGAPDQAELWIGMLDEHKLGVKWAMENIGNTTVIRKSGWEIRLLKDAAEQIQREAEAWGHIETGGVLIGRVSVLHRCFTISRVLEAPPDSQRSETQFVLGTQGLKERVRQVCLGSGKLLTYAGIWHSHPRGSDPSGRDKATLLEMRKHRLGAPCLSLIWTPRGFRVLVDDGRIAEPS